VELFADIRRASRVDGLSVRALLTTPNATRHERPAMSQDSTARTCLASGTSQRGYCGRKSNTLVADPAKATCRECGAAVRADQQAGIAIPELAAAIAC
jgi:hypothetical protein